MAIAGLEVVSFNVYEVPGHEYVGAAKRGKKGPRRAEGRYARRACVCQVGPSPLPRESAARASAEADAKRGLPQPPTSSTSAKPKLRLKALDRGVDLHHLRCPPRTPSDGLLREEGACLSQV